MGQCVDKLPHECGTSKGLQVYLSEDGSINGYCWACDTYVDDPYGDKPVPEFTPKTPEEIAAELREYADYPVYDLPKRRLMKKYLQYFGVRMQVSEQDGVTPTATMFPYGANGELTGWKVATLGEVKKQWCIGTTKGANLFGWARAIKSGARTLYITEGEYDAVALQQILDESQIGTKYEGMRHAVTSLRNGAGSAKRDLIGKGAEEINRHFEEVVLVFDMDAPGRDAAEAVSRANPNWLVAELPCKDANECLVEGASKACKAAVVFRATKPKNSRVVVGSSLHEHARVAAEPGLSTPWPTLTELTRGIRRGESWYWGAGVKMGKSELVNALAAWMIKEHKLPVFLAKPEEALNKSYKMLAGKIVGRIFHDPNQPFDEEAYDRAGEIMKDLALFTDVYQFLHWDMLKQDIVYANQELGVQDFFIDPITCFTNQMSASEANEFLIAMAADIAAISKDLELTFHLFCHLKAPANGEPHERGGHVYSTQFTGSRGMMRSCNYMIGMEGNKDPDLPEHERNIRELVLLEDREFGASGKVRLYWDSKSGVFSEL